MTRFKLKLNLHDLSTAVSNEPFPRWSWTQQLHPSKLKQPPLQPGHQNICWIATSVNPAFHPSQSKVHQARQPEPSQRPGNQNQTSNPRIWIIMNYLLNRLLNHLLHLDAFGIMEVPFGHNLRCHLQSASRCHRCPGFPGQGGMLNSRQGLRETNAPVHSISRKFQVKLVMIHSWQWMRVVATTCHLNCPASTSLCIWVQRLNFIIFPPSLSIGRVANRD